MKRLETNEGWENRYEQINEPSYFEVVIFPFVNILYRLDKTEAERLQKKLKLLENYTRKLAVGMLKGTLKYPTDNWTVEQWMHEEEDEEIDRINYRLLKQDAIAKEEL